MSRWALRNQSRIANKLGNKTLNRLVASLDYYFKSNNTIPEIDSTGEAFPTKIVVPDTSRIETSFEFYVTGKTYDVIRLAYNPKKI